MTDDLHEAAVKAFMDRVTGNDPGLVRRICERLPVKSGHQLAHIRRTELDFDPKLFDILDWSDRLAVGGAPVVQGI